jgi:hypothetical protein
MDRSAQPVWPRWVGYLNLWIGMSAAGGAIAVFFKNGRFACSYDSFDHTIRLEELSWRWPTRMTTSVGAPL